MCSRTTRRLAYLTHLTSLPEAALSAKERSKAWKKANAERYRESQKELMRKRRAAQSQPKEPT